MRNRQLTRKSGNSLVLVKLLAAVCLLVMAWANHPAHANCPGGAQLSAVCYTADSYGNQECQSLSGGFDGDVFCDLVSISGGGPVHTGCNGGTCSPPEPE